jgi:hypothetical protein
MAVFTLVVCLNRRTAARVEQAVRIVSEVPSRFVLELILA